MSLRNTKDILVFLTFTVFTSSVYAEWVFLADQNSFHNTNEPFSLYIKKSERGLFGFGSLKTEVLLKYGILQTSKKGKIFSSKIEEYEVDCKKVTLRLVSKEAYHEGKIVFSNNRKSEWQTTSAYSLKRAIVVTACATDK